MRFVRAKQRDVVLAVLISAASVVFLFVVLRPSLEDTTTSSSASSTATPEYGGPTVSLQDAIGQPLEHVSVGYDPTPASASSTATPGHRGPIMSRQDAISRSLEIFPEGHNPHSAVARLVSYYTLELYQAGVEAPQPTPARDEFAWSGTDPDDPVWLVAIKGDALTDLDVIQQVPVIGVTWDNPEPVPGAFYAWDANSGGLVVISVIQLSGAQTYESLAALSTESIPVHQATAVPTPPLYTPLPTHTWHPDDVATIIAQLTAYATSTASATSTP